jgi:hypothetical protein
MEMPKPGEPHRKLHRFIGNWIGEEKLTHAPGGPVQETTGHWAMRMDIENFFLIQDYAQEKDGKTTYAGHGIVGWDEKRQTYLWYWVDSMGAMPHAPSAGTWDNDTVTFTGKNPDGTPHGRYTFQFTGEESLLFKIENSQDGGKTWGPFMEGNYRHGNE